MGFIEKLRAITDISERPQPGGSYIAVNIRNGAGTVAIQFPIDKGKLLFQGVLGRDLTTDEGYQAGRLCGINVAKQLVHFVKEEDFVGINHLQIVYQCTDEWNEAPIVANGISDLLNEVFGDKGVHTRSIWASNRLPNNFSVGVVASFTVK